jgi:hypothetical protein
LTAFLGKEYSNLIPIPGYEALVTTQFATKVVDAAQSPSGTRFAIANGMNEIYFIDYKNTGVGATLSPRRLKKAPQKLSSGSFKPGQVILAMPQENLLFIFCVKDSKLLFRAVKVGDSESVDDKDLRPHFDSAMREMAAVSPTLLKEMKLPNERNVVQPAGKVPIEMPVPDMIVELPVNRSATELPTPVLERHPVPHNMHAWKEKERHGWMFGRKK